MMEPPYNKLVVLALSIVLNKLLLKTYVQSCLTSWFLKCDIYNEEV